MATFHNGRLNQAPQNPPQIFLNGITEEQTGKFLNGLIIEYLLDQITLSNGTQTIAIRTLAEERSLNYNILSLIASQPQFAGLRKRSQLSLDSASATLQYKQTTQTLTDFTASDIRYSGYIWHGEHASDTTAGNVANINTVYFRTSDLQWRGVSSNDAGVTTWSNFDQGTGLLQPTTWLGGLSDTEISNYFNTNTYNASRNYYVYQQSSGQVRKITRTDTWETLAADAEYDDVSGSELTLNTDTLLSNLRLAIALALNSISADKPDWRVKVDLVSGSATYTIYLLIQLQNVEGFQLQSGDIDGTTREIQEGMSITRNLLPAIQSQYPGIQTWDEIHIESITATMKYHNGTDWITMVVGQEYDEVTTDELTMDLSNLLSQGTYILHLTEDAITNRKINKFRTDITINS